MKNIALLFIACTGIASCTKEQNRKELDAFFNFKVDGNAVSIKDGTLLNDNMFDCTISGDTALYVAVDNNIAQGAGFAVKGYPLKDSTYTLDSLQMGYYVDPNDGRRYRTNNVRKGTLTFKRGLFQAKDMLNIVEGTFSFEAEDTITHVVHVITEGSFKMERKNQ